MLKKIISSKRGEGYIDVCITTVIFVMLTVVALNIFSFITLKAEMDQIADELIVMATHTGRFGEEFTNVDMDMIDNYYYYDMDYGAEEFFTNRDKVQLGKRMWVEISVDTEVKGLGVFKIPITLSVRRSGISEVYWK